VGRGINKRIGVNGACLADTEASIDDYAMSLEVCPVGCIIRKGEGFFAPVGERQYDQDVIGSDIEHHQHKHAPNSFIPVIEVDPREIHNSQDLSGDNTKDSDS